MQVEVGMAALPRIDEHWIAVAATPERVWTALERVLLDAMGGSAWKRLYATFVGAREQEEAGGGSIDSSWPRRSARSSP